MIFGLTIAEVGGVVAAIATLLGSWVTLRKLRPERDTLVLTSAQGAATILNDLVKTLREEIDRLRKHEDELEADGARKDARIHELEAEVAVLLVHLRDGESGD